MQIEEYNPNYLNLSEFIEVYRISMILNNEIIKKLEFELENYNTLMKLEAEEFYQETKEEFKEDYKEEIKEYGLEDAKQEYLSHNYETIEERLYYAEVFQYYIVPEQDIKLFKKYLSWYPIYYNYDIDLYLIGVTHYGSSWSFSFTEAPRPEYMKNKEFEKILNGTAPEAAP